MSRPWRTELRRGTGDELLRDHTEHLDGSRWLIWMEVSSPVLVLGSSQGVDTIDVAECRRRGVAIARRRSGGGAVLVEPGALAWLDVVLPASDELVEPDVGRSMWWVGEAWADALRAARAGDDGGFIDVHRTGLISTTWSRTVCFAGLGCGEVTIGGRKAVGVSQRRTRDTVRLQCAAVLTWRPERLVPLLAPPRPTVDALPPVATVDVPIATLRDFVAAAIAAR